MSVQTVKLLHVEDNVSDRLLMAKLLANLKEYEFNIIRAATEITAVAELNKGGVEFVVLDYKLPLGDGLSCLRKLRQIDAAVPIVVLSGVTTPEMGAECLKAGANDYLSKQDLTAEKLADVVRKGFGRASAWPALQNEVRPLCEFFLTNTGPDFFKALDDIEQALKKAEVQPAQVAALFESIAADLEKAFPKLPTSPVRLVRPLILELVERLTPKPPKQARPSSRPVL
jgi:CheY-like chemotaxis protein